jgi:hypothetical protein
VTRHDLQLRPGSVPTLTCGDALVEPDASGGGGVGNPDAGLGCGQGGRGCGAGWQQECDQHG